MNQPQNYKGFRFLPDSLACHEAQVLFADSNLQSVIPFSELHYGQNISPGPVVHTEHTLEDSSAN